MKQKPWSHSLLGTTKLNAQFTGFRSCWNLIGLKENRLGTKAFIYSHVDVAQYGLALSRHCSVLAWSQYKVKHGEFNELRGGWTRW